jgi:hypothetical protein
MTEQDSLNRFGVSPDTKDLPTIRDILRQSAGSERSSQGTGDTELMKLCCVQLFCGGQLHDVLEIWGAKTASMDADGSIDIQLLCGAGLSKTKNYLAGLHTEEAGAALERLVQSEAAGHFEGFDTSEYKAFWEYYYLNPLPPR